MCQYFLDFRYEHIFLGNIDTSLSINEESLRVAKVSLNNGKIIDYNNILMTGEKWIPSSSLGDNVFSFDKITYLAGQRKSRLHLVEVEDAGLYQIDFVAEPGQEVQDIRENIKTLGRIKGEKNIFHSVSVSEYIYVN